MLICCTYGTFNYHTYQLLTNSSASSMAININPQIIWIDHLTIASPNFIPLNMPWGEGGGGECVEGRLFGMRSEAIKCLFLSEFVVTLPFSYSVEVKLSCDLQQCIDMDFTESYYRGHHFTGLFVHSNQLFSYPFC